MAKLTPMDYAFLALESPESPKHVAGLQIFEPPKGIKNKRKFVQDLFADLMQHTECTAPFNQKLKVPRIGLPEWIEDEQLELEYHVRHSVLPRPGSRRQLYEMVSRLHANLLDRSRPVWECHLIEGLEKGRFAIYTKIHHALADGISASRFLTNGLSESPDDASITPIWAPRPRERKRREREDKGLLDDLKGAARLLKGRLSTTVGLSKLILKLKTQAMGLNRETLPIPFTASTTDLNLPLAKAKTFSAAAFPMERFKAIGKAADASLNDVLLTVCDMAIQWYLRDHGTTLDKPLVCQMPVSLRREGEEGGNQIAIALIELGTVSADPLTRLNQIKAAAGDLKEEYGAMDAEVAMIYTLLVQGAAQVADSLKLGEQLPPLGNIMVSNVPGPREALYLNGARLQEIYPLSVMPPGQASNVTVLSYAGDLNMGVIAGRSALPELEGMTDHMWEAFEALETAIVGEARP